MSKLFNQVSFGKPKRALHDLSHEKKISMQMGKLYPILLHEVVPGDTFRVNTESLIRFAPMVAPVMHRVNAYVHYFFVPNRILMREGEWEKFITGGEDGKQVQTMYNFNITTGDEAYLTKGTLMDYFGLPLYQGGSGITSALKINALPFMAYNKIWNEYYRDQNIMAKIPERPLGVSIGSTDIPTFNTIRSRCWEKDYFTSALPWSQRGDEILLPNEITYKNPSSSDMVVDAGGASQTGPLSALGGSLQTNTVNSMIQNIEAIAVTINDLRRSARLQEFLEKTARGGSRLTEVVKSFFGVQSSDARLQRPEFLGGGKTPITISEVLATFNSTEVAGGTMYGHGLSVGNTNKFKRFFEEHGWIIGIMSVLPRTTYQQGVEKHFLKFDKFDYYWPTFAQLGEQEVKNIELWFDYQSSADKDGTFGYQSRYAEYKHARSMVCGDMRDNLDFWHMGRKWDTKPALNEQFVLADPTQRIFADTDETTDKLWVQLYNDVKALRPIPYFNNPIL